MSFALVIFDWAGTLVDHGSRAPMGAPDVAARLRGFCISEIVMIAK